MQASGACWPRECVAEGTLRAYFVSNDGVPVDAYVLGMLPEDLANTPTLSRR